MSEGFLPPVKVYITNNTITTLTEIDSVMLLWKYKNFLPYDMSKRFFHTGYNIMLCSGLKFSSVATIATVNRHRHHKRFLKPYLCSYFTKAVWL